MAQELAERDRKRLALHEAAHVIAADCLSRPIGRVWIDPDGGWAEIGCLPDGPASLDDVVSELTILLIGRVVTRSPSLPWDEERDEARAIAVASRYCRTPDEISALVAFGRARARTLAAQGPFIERVEQLWPVLAEQSSMSAEQIHDHLNGKESINGASQS